MKTLLQRFDDLEGLWGNRNRLFLEDKDRPYFLINAVRRLAKAVRMNEQDPEVLTNALARVFSRTWTFASKFGDMPGIVAAMSQKFPIDHCAYCKREKGQCKCLEARQGHIVLAPIDPRQLTWGVTEWCDHVHTLYGSRNIERGLPQTVGRLYEEVCEVLDAWFLGTRLRDITYLEVGTNLTQEFADVFLWTFAIAGMKNLSRNVEVALERRHAGIHERCGKRPCICGPYYNYIERQSASFHIHIAETRTQDEPTSGLP